MMWNPSDAAARMGKNAGMHLCDKSPKITARITGCFNIKNESDERHSRHGLPQVGESELRAALRSWF